MLLMLCVGILVDVLAKSDHALDRRQQLVRHRGRNQIKQVFLFFCLFVLGLGRDVSNSQYLALVCVVHNTLVVHNNVERRLVLDCGHCHFGLFVDAEQVRVCQYLVERQFLSVVTINVARNVRLHTKARILGN